eukprot:480390-Alexandrium_andersonii.AAC.1
MRAIASLGTAAVAAASAPPGGYAGASSAATRTASGTASRRPATPWPSSAACVTRSPGRRARAAASRGA